MVRTGTEARICGRTHASQRKPLFLATLVRKFSTHPNEPSVRRLANVRHRREQHVETIELADTTLKHLEQQVRPYTVPTQNKVDLASARP